MAGRKTWDAAMAARLRDLWADGLTASAIGIEMGISKSAVLGRAHRQGLPARPSPIRPAADGVPRVPRPRRIASERTLPVLAAPPPPPSVQLPPTFVPPPVAVRAPPPVLIPHAARCLFPLWEDSTPRAERRFCGAPAAAPGCSWCPAHRAIVFVPAPPLVAAA